MFYPILSGRDNLRVFTRTAGNEDAGTIARVLERVGLSERAKDKVKTYSLGMKQRPLGLIPIAVMIFYLIVPITVAAIVFRKRDMVGAA